MKRSKKTARGSRSGVSPYRRHGKTPCRHCRDLILQSREKAQKGDSYVNPS